MKHQFIHSTSPLHETIMHKQVALHVATIAYNDYMKTYS